MDELVRWLGKQLDEDERIAQAAGHERVAPTPWRGESWDDAVLDGDGLVDARGNGIAIVKGERVRDHMARHDPARVLREIDAKRAVVARYEFACREASRVNLAEDERETWIRVGGALQSVVIQLAAPYAERPGYKAEEWTVSDTTWG